MDAKNDNVLSVINKIYSKTGFLDKYGGSLWTAAILCIVFFIAISYYQIYNNIRTLANQIYLFTGIMVPTG